MQEKRQVMLDRFFTSYDKATLEELLSDNAQIVEQSPKSRTYNKSEWINVLTNHVVPAIPDYKWCHATDATKDKDGYCLVKVQVRHLPLHLCCSCNTRVYLCVSSLCLCELLFAGYWTSHWQAIANPWLRNGKGDNTAYMLPVSLLLLMPAINIATSGQEQSLFESNGLCVAACSWTPLRKNSPCKRRL